MEMFPQVEAIFGRAEEMGQDVAHDLQSGQPVHIPPVHIVLAGFPCTDASSLNSASFSSANRSCVPRLVRSKR
eukprot:2589380-Lingulodinium_polyedra.AAC.1